MERRRFIRDASIAAVGFGVFGKVVRAQKGFVGNSPTATDILGPFYRPNAPIRTNLNPRDFKGRPLHLSGTIYDEKKIAIKDCLVEVWQCESDGFYDNLSSEYRYRGSQKTKKDGKYFFITTKPVPEPVNEKREVFRPPHIHFRISAKGQQDLITQIYFAGEPLLESDPSTRAGLAMNRTLHIKRLDDQSDAIRFDIYLKKEFLPEDALFEKLSGVYEMNDGSMMEFYRNGDLLFYKVNNQIWGALAYRGDNSFGQIGDHTEARFEILGDGAANVLFRFSRRKETKLQGTKILSY